MECVCMWLCVQIFTEETFLNPKVLSEGLETAQGMGVDFRLIPVSILDAFPSGISCTPRSGVLVWLVGGAVVVSGMTQKNLGPR